MILGIGTDLVDSRRIGQALERFGERFLARVFTDRERAEGEALAPTARTAFYARRFAAKEAGAKALGTGFAAGVGLRDLGVVRGPGGAPVMELADGALQRLNALTPAGMIARVHLSLSDESPLALAFVTIEAVPAVSILHPAPTTATPP